jgi:hypothetical protein
MVLGCYLSLTKLIRHVFSTPKIVTVTVLKSSPYFILTVVKTGRLDFSFCWLEDEVRKNLVAFLKANKIRTFIFPLPHVPIPFTQQTCCTSIFKRMHSISLEWNIEYQTLYGSNFRNMGAPFTWILEKKYDF